MSDNVQFNSDNIKVGDIIEFTFNSGYPPEEIIIGKIKAITFHEKQNITYIDVSNIDRKRYKEKGWAGIEYQYILRKLDKYPE